jgi:hypothetical protein
LVYLLLLHQIMNKKNDENKIRIAEIIEMLVIKVISKIYFLIRVVNITCKKMNKC